MKKGVNLILGFLMLIIVATLSVAAYFYLQKNEISFTNRLKREAKKEYRAGQYFKAYQVYSTLVDSLNVKDDGLIINYGNAALLSSELLSGSNHSENAPGEKAGQADTSRTALDQKAMSEYFKLFNSSNKKISSLAFNQAGFTNIKKGETLTDEKLDSVFAESLTHFKEALRKDPSNDSARYNYELLKKITGYPETILAQTKALVTEKKYKEAATLLESAMQRDRRLNKNRDFLQRIQKIIGIDTLKSPKSRQGS